MKQSLVKGRTTKGTRDLFIQFHPLFIRLLSGFTSMASPSGSPSGNQAVAEDSMLGCYVLGVIALAVDVLVSWMFYMDWKYAGSVALALGLGLCVFVHWTVTSSWKSRNRTFQSVISTQKELIEVSSTGSISDQMTQQGILAGILQRMMELTGSKFGFIAERANCESGGDFVQVLAVLSSDSNSFDSLLHGARPLSSLPFRFTFDPQSAATATTSSSSSSSSSTSTTTMTATVLSNVPTIEQQKAAEEQGFPVVHRSMGIPVVLGNTVVGMIGLCNSHKLYSSRQMSSLQPLVQSTNVVFSSVQSARATIKEKELKDEAERTSRQKTNFLTNTAHELSQPLNGIIAFAEFLSMMNLQDKSARDMVDRITKSGAHLEQLIKGLLDMGRIEAGEMSMAVHLEGNIVLCVQDAYYMTSSLALKRGINLLCELPTTKLHAICDVSRTRQILVNLISNAIKFTKEGYVKVTVDVQPVARSAVKVTSGTTPPQAALVVTVADTGVGMSESARLKLFSPYCRVQKDEECDNKFGGNGLGLCISKNLAQLMGGDILVTSQLGKGSQFMLYLPTTMKRSDFESEVGKCYDRFTNRIILVGDKESHQCESIRNQCVGFGFPEIKRLMNFAELQCVNSSDYRDTDIVIIATRCEEFEISILSSIPTSICKVICLCSATGRCLHHRGEQLQTLSHRIYLVKTPLFPMDLLSTLMSHPSVEEHDDCCSGAESDIDYPSDDSSYSLDEMASISVLEDTDVDGTLSPPYHYTMTRRKSIPSPHSSIHSKYTCLIVDDSEIGREVIINTLAMLDIDYEVAANGKQAWSLIQEQPERFDLVVTDLNMPQLSGTDLVRKIRQSPDGLINGKVVLALTANKLATGNELLRNYGFDGAMEKPIRPMNLVALLRNYIPATGSHQSSPSQIQCTSVGTSQIEVSVQRYSYDSRIREFGTDLPHDSPIFPTKKSALDKHASLAPLLCFAGAKESSSDQ